jgi:acetylornithine deacetylase
LLPAAREGIDLAFWTEAALLSEAGIDAVVYGPGRIEQAHAADEYVAVAELETAHAAFLRMLTGPLAAAEPAGPPR